VVVDEGAKESKEANRTICRKANPARLPHDSLTTDHSPPPATIVSSLLLSYRLSFISFISRHQSSSILLRHLTSSNLK